MSRSLFDPTVWYDLRPHKTQYAYWSCESRFIIVPAGRRSGKTIIAKRKGITKALEDFRDLSPSPFYAFAAPTRDQAKKIFWEDICRMVPREFMAGRPRESDLEIRLKHGPIIAVVGLDAPQRIEGRPLDWICIDETGNTKPDTFERHVSPSLDTEGRLGSALLIGVPRGRNHYYKLFKKACEGEWGNASAFTWKSSEILSPETIAAAKARMDKLTYEQEYDATFLNFLGRAYKPFTEATHCDRFEYNPSLPLIFTFDFNVSPGVAGVFQEQYYKGDKPNVDRRVPISAKIGEVWIEQESDTKLVCRELIRDWKHHTGFVYIYGDATGGAKKTSQTEGTDWDIAKAQLRPVFGERLKFRVPDSNPLERVRLNAMNTRLQTADDQIRLMLDNRLKYSIADYEGTVLKKDGSGELDKDDDPDRTHMTDGDGYYIAEKFPLQDGNTVVQYK